MSNYDHLPSHEIIVRCSLSVKISRRNCHNWICPLLPVRLPWWPASTPNCDIIPVNENHEIIFDSMTHKNNNQQLIPNGLIAFTGFRPFGFGCFFICVTFSSDVFAKSGSPRIATILHLRNNSKCVQNVSPGSTGTFSWNSFFGGGKRIFFVRFRIQWTEKHFFYFTFERKIAQFPSDDTPVLEFYFRLEIDEKLMEFLESFSGEWNRWILIKEHNMTPQNHSAIDRFIDLEALLKNVGKSERLWLCGRSLPLQ